jgi:hypothetical protein
MVELKHTNVTSAEVIKSYCQRVNAASRALRIFENLSRSSDIVDGEQVPPVIVLTFIDSKFKLWIAFSTLDSNSTPSYVCGKRSTLLLKHYLILWAENNLYQGESYRYILESSTILTDCRRHVILGGSNPETTCLDAY